MPVTLCGLELVEAVTLTARYEDYIYFCRCQGVDVSDFEQALLRLKERLGVASDKAVAELLGMGEKALNARKRRGAFPEDKLKALANDRPDLKLDVKYVITGTSDELERRLGAIKRKTELSLRLYPDDSAKGMLVRDVLIGVEFDSRDVIDAAIDHFLAASRPKKRLSLVAERAAEYKAKPTPKTPRAKR